MADSTTDAAPLPCWRGCPIYITDGTRHHQWPCQLSGLVEDYPPGSGVNP